MPQTLVESPNRSFAKIGMNFMGLLGTPGKASIFMLVNIDHYA